MPGNNGILGLHQGDGNGIQEAINRNRALHGAPGACAAFDFSDMGRLGNNLLNARDESVHRDASVQSLRYSGAISDGPKDVEDWRSEVDQAVASEIHTFLANRMESQGTSEPIWGRVRHAIDFLRLNGAARGAQLASIGVQRCDAQEKPGASMNCM